ncbi:MAG: reverse transcriptase domain-containing protein [Candidatus Thiodiazotropha endolucinida]|nr:hypothetical protein [Candidatus Thiodiazotropha taylori]MCW4264205.1 reverse transcriptase domain-containing protein [Candidatus Thiodiazotropha endolucinida]
MADEEIDLSVSIPAEKENALLSSSEIVFMQTARTKLKDPLGLRDLEVRILLDSGSQRTYVTERLAKSLNLEKGSEQEIRLVTFGSVTPKVIKTASTKLNIQLKNGEEMKVVANIVPNITSAIHRKPVNISDMRSFDALTKNLNLADTVPTEPETDTIDLLIGNDYYLDIVMGHKIEVQPGLYLLSSKLGWILTGRTNEVEENVNDINMLILTYGNNITKTEVFTSVDESLPSKPDLEDFWKLEAIGISENMENTDDERAMKNFRDTLTFRDERYHITWPWKEENPEIPDNRPLAVGRLKSLISRLQSRPDVLKKYNAVIKDQLDKNIIEKVDKTVSDGIRHYIPHHAVVKPEKSTTKLRIVYDASAKSKCENRSLNECLYRGPVLLNDLCGTLIRFRLHKIGIVADIEKAFLQICLQNSQRDVTRFLWLKDLEHPSVNQENIQEYRFCRVPFGVISSPFLLGATINYHLDSYDSDIAKKIKKDIYMDNLITGVNSVSEAITLYKNSKQIFSEANMNLREWASNAEEVNISIPVKDRAAEETIKVLGLVWNRDSDTIRLQQTKILKDIGITKRTVLKQIAGVFDPLGLFSPIILKGKLLLQSLWIKHLQWDDDLVEEDVKIWLPIKNDLITVSDYEISRQVTTNKQDGIASFLVCFCDASSKAYATTIYLVQHSKRERKSELMLTKTRLAPTTSTTIPRLELMAVLIGVRSVEFVRKQIAALVDCTYLFTDSQCTLKWIVSTKQLSVFVKNRVQEIKSYKDIEFHYVDTKSNPADIASRGSTMQKLANNALWWHGPEWLKKPLNEWPLEDGTNLTEEKVKKEFESEIKHERKIDVKSLLSGEIREGEKRCFPISAPFEIDSRQYSSVIKLFRVTATAMRFIKRLKGETFTTEHLTKDEVEKVEQMWVLHIQRMNFEDVFHSITSRKRNNLQTQLGVYVDDDGILRCKGRLEYSSLTEAARHPILLPNKGKLTHLIIESVHKQLLHSGVSQTLSKLRYRFWVPKGRATVRKVINNCLVCRRTEGGPYKMPPMAQLPPGRVSKSTPFSQTGLDYMGPLYIKEENQTKKVWVCLFTCMVTRAVHIEMVADMSTNAFLNCFRRFIASRGTPNEIVCDNAMHFKLASETTELIWRDIIRCDEVQSYSSSQRIKWTFIVELAPWMGGFYERLVGLIKRSLRKAIGRKLLDSDKLNTVLKEAEATVNSRPLVYVGDDINSTVVITPGHFICLNPNTGIPQTEIHDKDPDFKPKESSAEVLLRIWKKGQKLLDSFWNIWLHEYLTSLRERTQMKLKSGKLQSKVSCRIGDIVLIKDNMPRGSWRLGKVIELIQSADGFVRSARVQTQSGRILGRPLCLLYPIETSDNKENESNDKLPI